MNRMEHLTPFGAWLASLAPKVQSGVWPAIPGSRYFRVHWLGRMVFDYTKVTGRRLTILECRVRRHARLTFDALLLPCIVTPGGSIILDTMNVAGWQKWKGANPPPGDCWFAYDSERDRVVVATWVWGTLRKVQSGQRDCLLIPRSADVPVLSCMWTGLSR